MKINIGCFFECTFFGISYVFFSDLYQRYILQNVSSQWEALVLFYQDSRKELTPPIFNFLHGMDYNRLRVVNRDRIEPGFIGSSSVRFAFVFLNSVRVRFGSASFFENQFGFGSVRPHLWRASSGSVRFDSNRTEPNRYNSTRFDSFSVSGSKTLSIKVVLSLLFLMRFVKETVKNAHKKVEKTKTNRSETKFEKLKRNRKSKGILFDVFCFLIFHFFYF